MLDAHSDISIAFDEMNLFEPFRSNTFDKFFENSPISSKELVELINKKQIYGTFWKEFEQSGIPIKDLEERLKEYPSLSSAKVLSIILDLLNSKRGTNFSGIKYPVHFKRLDYIFDHWPEAKVIFLTRNPKAIIASKLNDEATQKRKGKSPLHRFLIHYFTILYFAIEYILSIRTYYKYKSQLKLITYERLVLNQRETINDLCRWCNIRFEDVMLEVTGKSSSHTNINSSGLHAKSLTKYKTALNSFDSALISILTNRYYTKIKDELGSNF
jgi:hypothetical protein